VVQHVCVGDEAIGLDSIDLDAKDSTGDHHPHLTVLLEGELSVLRNSLRDVIVVRLDVPNLLTDLVLEGTAIQPLPFLLGVEDWEVVEGFWQDIDILVEV